MKLDEWLGIELPIIQAPMAGVRHHEQGHAGKRKLHFRLDSLC